MKKIMAVVLSLLACTVLLAGCNTSSESNEEQSLKVYSFSGENEYISVGHLPGAGFHCGRYHAFPGSASLAGRIHRTVFRHSGKQRRQSQTAVGCAAQ